MHGAEGEAGQLPVNSGGPPSVQPTEKCRVYEHRGWGGKFLHFLPFPLDHFSFSPKKYDLISKDMDGKPIIWVSRIDLCHKFTCSTELHITHSPVTRSLALEKVKIKISCLTKL